MQPSSAEQSPFAGGFDEIHWFTDRASGLRAVVVLDDTSAGPALGGVRCAAYPDENSALADVGQLARAMTFKCLLAGLPAGGGKAVVLDHPGLDRPAAFAELGGHVERMGGRFFCAGDLGTTAADLRAMARATRFVATPENGVTEDLGAKAAEGVFLAAGTGMDLLGIAEWKGQRIAIQGLGKIGIELATLARRAGAQVFAADVDAQRAGRAADTVPITLVGPEEILDLPCTVFAPCGKGGILDARTIPRLRCRIVCGAANGQLTRLEDADLLLERGILHAPDSLASAGALLAGCGPALPGFERPRDLSGIGARLRDLWMESIARQIAPERIAIERATRGLERRRARLDPDVAVAARN